LKANQSGASKRPTNACSRDVGELNWNSLKQDVTGAGYKDWKRDVVDEAKKRAVYQAPTYDDFKQLVAGCTLKPLGKSDFRAPPKVCVRNTVGASANSREAVVGQTEEGGQTEEVVGEDALDAAFDGGQQNRSDRGAAAVENRVAAAMAASWAASAEMNDKKVADATKLTARNPLLSHSV
jgi:hypothetical protein